MDGCLHGLITCPDCGTDTPVGLPRSTANRVVTPSPSAELDAVYLDGDDSRRKRRHACCPNGHSFYMYFEF